MVWREESDSLSIVVGGAAEMIVTGGIVTEHGHSSWYMLIGYSFLFCNSFFTVSVLLRRSIPCPDPDCI